MTCNSCMSSTSKEDGRVAHAFFASNQGQVGRAIEYALIAALIAVAAIAAFTLVGTNLSTTFSYVASQL
jgi:Flp pilus assembly pilin Flp